MVKNKTVIQGLTKRCINCINARKPKGVPAVIKCGLCSRMFVANAVRSCEFYAKKTR